jgi:hypothetical protein
MPLNSDDNDVFIWDYSFKPFNGVQPREKGRCIRRSEVQIIVVEEFKDGVRQKIWRGTVSKTQFILQ